MATITKRGRGYRVQVRMHGRKPQSKSFRTHALAVRWAREVEHALERAEMPSEADLGALCLKYRKEVYGATARPQAGLKHYDKLARDLTGVRFHDLRHEAATRLLEAGYSIPETALVTGHKDWNTLRRYAHLRVDDLHQGPASKRKSGPEDRAERAPSTRSTIGSGS